MKNGTVQGRNLVGLTTIHPDEKPFGNKTVVAGSEPVGNGAASLQLNPVACDKQLAALFASAGERNRRSAYFGANCLRPLLVAGADSVEEAARVHARLFGFEPVHPDGGEWIWDPATGMMVSSLYGTSGAQCQQAYDPENKNFGLFHDISRMALGIQFEEDGLRSTVRWRTK